MSTTPHPELPPVCLSLEEIYEEDLAGVQSRCVISIFYSVESVLPLPSAPLPSQALKTSLSVPKVLSPARAVREGLWSTAHLLCQSSGTGESNRFAEWPHGAKANFV